MTKYIGKPTREIKINLKDFKNTNLKKVMLNLKKQDKLNLNKSYAFYFM